MIRPNNRLFWLIGVFLALGFIPLIFRPVRQALGALVWDSVLVPLYARIPLLVSPCLGGIQSEIWIINWNIDIGADFQ